jgi:hypothetical protein
LIEYFSDCFLFIKEFARQFAVSDCAALLFSDIDIEKVGFWVNEALEISVSFQEQLPGLFA